MLKDTILIFDQLFDVFPPVGYRFFYTELAEYRWIESATVVKL